MATPTFDMTPKGVLLAGGRGTQLYPLTRGTSKQLQPVFNKPLIYYPLTTLMSAGVREILVITAPQDSSAIGRTLGDGHAWGIRLEYAVQPEPRGVADALLVGRDFIGEGPVVLMLGDNVLLGDDGAFLRDALAPTPGGGNATIFRYRVADPRRFGVVELDGDGNPIALDEKPPEPRSPWAVPGVYVYGPSVAGWAQTLVPSARGELEITDLNRMVLRRGGLRVAPIGETVLWFDAGTPRHLLEASIAVQALEARLGRLVGSPEACSLQLGYVTPAQYRENVAQMPDCEYRRALEALSEPAVPTVRPAQ